MTASPSSIMRWSYFRMVMAAVVVTAITLSQPVSSQPCGIHHGRLYRRSLLSISLNSFYSFCWKDAIPRKLDAGCSAGSPGVQQQAANSAIYNDASGTSACLSACPDGFNPFGPVCRVNCSSLSPTGWVSCGAGCAVDKPTCSSVQQSQVKSLTFWLQKTVIPATQILSKIAKVAIKSIGFTFAKPAASVAFTPPVTPGTDQFEFIAQKTYEKRAMVAMQLVMYGQKDSGAIATFKNPERRPTPVVLKQLLASYLVPIAAVADAAMELKDELTVFNVTVNIEDIARLDPTGTGQVLTAYGHPLCRKRFCARCNVTANPCIASVECTAGKCSPVVPEPDGTPCVISDWQAHTVSGFCVQGNCNASLTASFYDLRQNGSIWFPANGHPSRQLQEVQANYIAANKTVADAAAAEVGLSGSNVSVSGVVVADAGASDGEGFQDSLIASEMNVTMEEAGLSDVSSAYVDMSLAYWHETAVQSLSCTFNNGGCGVFPCEVDFDRAPPTTKCVDPADLGFMAAPMATDFPDGPDLAYLHKTDARQCMEECSRLSGCQMVVTTRMRDCWLKGTVTDAVPESPFFQAYKRL